MLDALDLYGDVCQLFLSKTGEGEDCVSDMKTLAYCVFVLQKFLSI